MGSHPVDVHAATSGRVDALVTTKATREEARLDEARGVFRHVDAAVDREHGGIDRAPRGVGNAAGQARSDAFHAVVALDRRKERRQIDVLLARVGHAAVRRLHQHEPRRERLHRRQGRRRFVRQVHGDLHRLGQRNERCEVLGVLRDDAHQPARQDASVDERRREPVVRVELERQLGGFDGFHQRRRVGKRRRDHVEATSVRKRARARRRALETNDVDLGPAPRVDDHVEPVAQRLEVATLAAIGLAAHQLLADGQVAIELFPSPAHLVVQLVRVLDEILEALGVRRRKTIEPDVDVGATRVRERGAQRLQDVRVIEIVEQVIARLRPGVAERDDVQEVELADAPAVERLHHLGQVTDVLLVDDDVEVDDHPLRVERRAQALHLFDEGARRADERVVQLRVVTM